MENKNINNMKPSGMLAILRQKTSEELKGVDPKSRKFIKVISNIDKEYGKKLDMVFIHKEYLKKKIVDVFKISEIFNKYDDFEKEDVLSTNTKEFELLKNKILKFLEE